jgi:integrative and conjugative element protein (TIGR02256 family)
MTEEFHELSYSEIIDARALTIPRARALFDAVARQRDYSLVQLLRRAGRNVATHECIVVEVECDGVPSRNPPGIQYRERLALCVPETSNRLVEVLALRKDFPLLMHENGVRPGAPVSLCLYFESPRAVSRTWTPQGFLRRIQWWLEKSARGELHPADQPVEQLFFETPFELVLPWNWSELKGDPARRFVVVQGPTRPDGGFTSFLESAPLSQAGVAKTAHLDLWLPAVKQGVTRDPSNLGELADLLATRGVDLLPAIASMLRDKVGESGTPASADEKNTIILLHIPILRSTDGRPENVTHRAFWAPIGSLALGEAAGALFKLEHRYFRNFMPSGQPTAWRDQSILPMVILQTNDAVAARQQSGYADGGPTGVLVGGGALGSAMLNLWSRAGWGRWTIIDKDHIKPHNLSRHTAVALYIGEPKATAIAKLNDTVMLGATQVVPLVGDAMDISSEFKNALSASSLVVDASTTLEYPRAVSSDDALPRHASTFLTPDGNSAVLLAEDAARSHRLRTLEAQYYRALIEQPWGDRHHTRNPRTFWSGASCRDISWVMPYSRILNHASTLAEQVQLLHQNDSALIRVWERHPCRGDVQMNEVSVSLERRFKLGEMDLFIDAGAEQRLRELRERGLPAETGGVLLGYYDFNIQAVVVVTGLPAPPDSKATQESFERGVEGLAEAVRAASARTAGVVGYIGEWHSHPRGHSASPSPDDLWQLIHLALGMADDGLPAVQLIVGEDLRVLQAGVT